MEWGGEEGVAGTRVCLYESGRGTGDAVFPGEVGGVGILSRECPQAPMGKGGVVLNGCPGLYVITALGPPGSLVHRPGYTEKMLIDPL